MGYYTDGVTYFWWDDNQNLGGADPHVIGTPHNLAEFAIAFPGVCDEMQNPAGGKTKAGLCYLISQNTVIGGKAGVDAFNQTTWTELASRYLFLAPGKTLTIRPQGAVPNVTLNHGSKVGTGREISGTRGVNWYQAANITFIQNCNLYGGKYETDATIQLVDSAVNNNIEAAGNQFIGNTGVLGSTATGLDVFNSLFGLDVNLTGAGLRNSDNLVVASKGTPSYLLTAAVGIRKPKGIAFLGNPSVAAIRVPQNWVLARLKWPNGSVPHVDLTSLNVDPVSPGAPRECEEVHFRVMDTNGEPIPNLPATLVSNQNDYSGANDPWFGVLRYSNIEGDYVWLDVNTADLNNLAVRSWGKTAGGVIVSADRLFTMSINLPSMAGYISSVPSRIIEWTAPGRDMSDGVPTSRGGDFYTTITVPIVMTVTTIPGSGIVDFEECALS